MYMFITGDQHAGHFQLCGFGQPHKGMLLPEQWGSSPMLISPCNSIPLAVLSVYPCISYIS